MLVSPISRSSLDSDSRERVMEAMARRRPRASKAEPGDPVDPTDLVDLRVRTGEVAKDDETRRANEKEKDKGKAPTTDPTREDEELDPRERAQVEGLRRRDREVRAHEAAHAAAAGGLGGGASYTYVTGPDGKRYAVGGEVPVRLATGHTPEETLRNAQQVRAAALAPAEPSSQDRAVAAQATAMEAAARMEMSRTRDVEAAERAVRARAQGASRASDNRTVDPEATLRQLEREQRTVRGGWKHLHSSGGCGGCAVAVAAYR